MPRPPKERLVMHRPRINEFGPYNDNKPNKDESLDNNGNATILTLDELEAMRLADLECLSQEEAAALMNVSRQTFGRIVEIARKKMADALINGKIVKIECEEYIRFYKRHLKCIRCAHEWEDSDGAKTNYYCPKCNSDEIIKMRRCGKECKCPLKLTGNIP
ncbi:MAG TPA: hypothetical protein DHM44_02515 [Flexistipes sinusarabici]|uniref:UPF0251 protein DHM44_02515 n=1 Tax=Flexistipes sinusarabici TaxID=2352 RepID=A0A3D5QA37_FLESI|nr:hypothetical protein [Flexistipes sinusarabici]